MTKVILYLMGKKGLSVLLAIIKQFDPQVVMEVVCSKDSGVVNDFYTDIKAACVENNITVYDRENYGTHNTYAIAIGWKWMLDTENLFIIHDSLLPKYRGFAPLVSMLINKEEEIGVTSIFASDTYDTGDIIERTSRKINYPIKIKDAIDIIISAYSESAINIIKRIGDGTISGESQDNSKASYSLWRDDEDYTIDWKMDAGYIRRFVDAVGFPYKGAKSYINGKQIRVLGVDRVDDVVVEGDRCVGKIIFMKNGEPTIVCGNGLIVIKKMIYEDGSEVKIKTFRTRFGNRKYD